jgi:DNA-binding CsgD family transcriptional regulator
MTGLDVDDELRWAWFIQAAISPLWDFDAWYAALTRLVAIARDAGALDKLPIMLAVLGTAGTWAGDFATSTALIAESDMYCEATGTHVAPFIAMLLTSMRGDHDIAVPLIEAAIADATTRGEGNAVAHAHWSAAVLYNGLGRYDQALASAVEAARDAPGLYTSLWCLPELIEAAVRTGKPEPAREALARLAESTQAAATDFGLGIEARSRALLASPHEAEHWYREAIARLGRTRLRPELARAHLVYGEWLRRNNRRTDARAELRVAHSMFTEIGCEAFAERSRRELLVTGDRVRKGTPASGGGLTPQEATVAALARDGRTNAEIGAELFLSARTVEWHLRKIFGKLGITSRRELADALEDRTRGAND